MSEQRVQPRFELETQRVARLEPAQELELAPSVLVPATGTASLTLAAAGVTVLVLGLAGLEIGNFVVDQFARAAALGWATLGVAGGGLSLLGAGVVRELRGLFRLRRVDTLRARLADPTTRRDAALEWLDMLPEGPALRPAVQAVNDPDSILPLLRAGPAASLRAQAQALGRTAATQVFALTAAVPSPALDGLVVGWRGVRLIREIAVLHGLRPGLLGSVALFRRTAWAAAHATAANFAADAVLRAAISHPLLAHVAGDVAGAGVAARRMITLARAADSACSPMPPE